MRKLLVSALVLIVAFSSCKRTDDEMLPDGYKFVAKMGFNLNLVADIGEITGGGTTTISLDDKDIVAMKIYNAIENEDKTYTVGDLYASGLFTGTQLKKGLSVELRHKQSYHIYSTIFREGKGLVQNVDGIYGSPLNIGNTYIDDFISDREVNKVMDLAGQSNYDNVVLGDRFSSNVFIVADYSKQNYNIPASRMAFKLKYNITEYYKGHTIKISVTTKEDIEALKVVERVIKYEDVDDITSDVGVTEETFNYPFVVFSSNKFTCEEKEVCITAKVYDGEKVIKKLTKVQKITNNHQYSVNINANPSKSQGLVISLDAVWDSEVTDIDLEEMIEVIPS